MVEFNGINIAELFGIEDAENEKPARLKEYFFRNRAYDDLICGLPIRILVGHKGVGKSALLRVAFLEDEDAGTLAVWIRPNDIQGIASDPDTDFNTLIEEWKTGIINVVASKVAETLMPGTEWGQHRPVAGTVRALVQAVIGIFESYFQKPCAEISSSVVQRFRHTHAIHIYLDDLDRGWEARNWDIRRLSALLNALRDLAGSETTIKFRLGLRSDVYFLVRTADESTDKIEGNIIWLSWDNHEILTLAAKRVETFFKRSVDEHALIERPQSEIASRLHTIITPRYMDSGKWQNAPVHRVLLSLVRRRPRDLVKLLSGAAKSAYKNKHNIITTVDLRQTFESYSGERLQDIINEFKTELPAIGHLVYDMKPSTPLKKRGGDRWIYTNDALIAKIRNIRQGHNFVFTNGIVITERSLAEFLYKIDFITARKDHEDGTILRRYFEQNRMLQSQFTDFGFNWEIHPAYRWALDPSDPLSVFNSLSLGADAR